MNHYIDLTDKHIVCVNLDLEEFTQNMYDSYACIGVTINMPRHTMFSDLSSDEQITFLSRQFRIALRQLKKSIGIHKTYEYCNDGHIHLHSMLRIPKSEVKKSITAGILSDIVKFVHRQVYKRLSLRRNMPQLRYDDKFKRIRTPMVTVQYMKDPDEAYRWWKYIHKDCVENIEK